MTAVIARLGEGAAPWLGRLRERCAPVLKTVTPLGWTLVGSALVAGIVGGLRGWLEFRTLAVMLATIAVVAWTFTLGRWQYRASLELSSRRVRIGDRALGAVTLRNERRGDAPATRVELPVGRNAAAFEVPRLPAGETHEEVFQVPARRRGVIVLGPVRSVRSDPLGLLRRQRTWTDPVELFIHPETVLLDSNATGFLRDVEGVTTQNLSSSDVSFHALREYRPGDDRRSIHWRTTARVGKLMVRQFEETMRSHLLVLLCLDAEAYARPEDFELAVSVVGSLGQAAIREERELSVLTSAGPLSFADGPGLLDALCRVAPGGPGSLKALAAQGATRVPAASTVALITGGSAEPIELRAARSVLPARATTFAVRCGRELETARRTASGLVVLDVAALPDLPRGLRAL